MPKKGKKSGKLSKMTEEERVMYLEQQRLAEEEMRKKKEDMLTQFLKVFWRYSFIPNRFHLERQLIQWPSIFWNIRFI